MPRQPTKKSPIRELRVTIGTTQIGFARALGVSPSALKRIENQDLKLSRKIAQRIQTESGADAAKLLSGKLRDVLGNRYTAQFYAKWKERYTKQNEWRAKEHARRLAWWIQVLLRAAAVKSKRRLWQVRDAIYDSVAASYSDFDLRRPVEHILSTYKPRVKWAPGQLTPEELLEIEEEARREESQYQSARAKWSLPTTQRRTSKQSSRRGGRA